MSAAQPEFPRKHLVEPVEQCVCRGDEEAGVNGTFWCQYHQCRKTPQWHKLCQTRPGYREAWNQSRGPGQVKVGPDPVPRTRGGPGTELTTLLSKWGIRERPDCPCKSHAAQMDRWGPDRCEERLETILSWLREEARRRRLPFSRLAAGALVRLAIRRARRRALPELVQPLADEAQVS